MNFPTGVCVGGKDSGDGSACSPLVSKWLQALIEQAAQTGVKPLSVAQVYMVAFGMTGDPVIAATAAHQYQTWLAMAAAMGDTRFADSTPAIVIPAPVVPPPVVVAQAKDGTWGAVAPPSPKALDLGFFANAVSTLGGSTGA